MGKTKQTFRKFVDIKKELLRVKPKSEHNRTIKMYSFFERFNGNDSVPWRIISVLNQILSSLPIHSPNSTNLIFSFLVLVSSILDLVVFPFIIYTFRVGVLPLSSMETLCEAIHVPVKYNHKTYIT